MEYPKVLVISNNSFSKTSNNGRTLGNLFMGWPKDRIAQFCISTTEPDYDVCENYYLLTDRSMLNGFKHLKKGKRCDIETGFGTEGNAIIGGKKVFKTPWKALFRHVVWSGRRWESKEFKEWVDVFQPEILVVMNSDSTFILDIATSLSLKKNLPLVMYNTEGFYLFTKSYFRKSKWLNNTAFHVYQSIYRHHFRRMMKRVVLSVHLNQTLASDYRNEFGGKHLVSYTGSNLQFDSSEIQTQDPNFTYLGNLGFDRPLALIEIAETLQDINADFKLDVYGRIPRPEVKLLFENCPGICFHGSISYEEVTNVIYDSTILFHAEAKTEKFKEALRYGFSTKIADSISSGHPFIMYSPRDIAGAEYIKETGAGWLAENKDELRTAILLILNNREERTKVLNVARRIAKENHNAVKNAQEFQSKIIEACSNYYMDEKI